MALVHDLAESIVGDLTPSSGVGKEEKYAREKVSTEKSTRAINSVCFIVFCVRYSMVTLA